MRLLRYATLDPDEVQTNQYLATIALMLSIEASVMTFLEPMFRADLNDSVISHRFWALALHGAKYIDKVFAVSQHVASGKLRAIAFTGAKRLNTLPELPTVAEAGVPDLVWRTGWQGWFAPARTPREIVIRLNREIRRALESPKVTETLAAGGYDVIADSPEQFRAFIQSEIKRYAEIARKANIRVD